MLRSRQRPAAPSRKRVRKDAQEAVVILRRTRGEDPVVVLEWADGAGELQCTTLSPAQSWPYLHRRN